MSKQQDLQKLFRDYETDGFWKGNEFLMPPDIAVRFALDLGTIDVGIEIVTTWQAGVDVEGRIGYREDLANELLINYDVLSRDDGVAKSISMAVDFIDQLPEISDYVSFTLSRRP